VFVNHSDGDIVRYF